MFVTSVPTILSPQFCAVGLVLSRGKLKVAILKGCRPLRHQPNIQSRVVNYMLSSYRPESIPLWRISRGARSRHWGRAVSSELLLLPMIG